MKATIFYILIALGLSQVPARCNLPILLKEREKKGTDLADLRKWSLDVGYSDKDQKELLRMPYTERDQPNARRIKVGSASIDGQMKDSVFELDVDLDDEGAIRGIDAAIAYRPSGSGISIKDLQKKLASKSLLGRLLHLDDLLKDVVGYQFVSEVRLIFVRHADWRTDIGGNGYLIEIRFGGHSVKKHSQFSTSYFVYSGLDPIGLNQSRNSKAPVSGKKFIENAFGLGLEEHGKGGIFQCTGSLETYEDESLMSKGGDIQKRLVPKSGK